MSLYGPYGQEACLRREAGWPCCWMEAGFHPWLGTILTWQICDDLYQDKEELAIALENSVILIAALIPWAIAGAVPVATIGAEITCLLAAFYLYLVPAWNLWISVRKQKFWKSPGNKLN